MIRCVQLVNKSKKYVQLAALISKTKVDELRQSCQVISVAAIIRTFNRWASEMRREVTRVQGSGKTSLFFDFFDMFSAQVDRATSNLGKV